MNYNSKGFSLIELLIAIAMAGVLSVAILSVFSNSISTNQVQIERAKIINDGAYVMEVVTSEIAAAGYSSEYISDYTVIKPVVINFDTETITVNDVGAAVTSLGNDELAIAFRANIYDDQTRDCVGANVSNAAVYSNTGWSLEQTSVINHYYLDNETTVNGVQVASLYCRSFIAFHPHQLIDFNPSTMVSLSSGQPLVNNVADFQVQYGIADSQRVIQALNQTQLVTSAVVDTYVNASDNRITTNPVYSIAIGLIFMPNNSQKESASQTTINIFDKQFSRNDSNSYFLFKKTVFLPNTPADVRAGG